MWDIVGQWCDEDSDSFEKEAPSSDWDAGGVERVWRIAIINPITITVGSGADERIPHSTGSVCVDV